VDILVIYTKIRMYAKTSRLIFPSIAPRHSHPGDFRSNLAAEPAMKPRLLATLALLCLACSVQEEGLIKVRDGGPDTGPTSLCPAGVVANASWSPAITAGSCTQLCGPDLLGTRLCAKADLAACKQTGECLCSSSPCTACPPCAFTQLSPCYQPTNAAALPACDGAVRKFGLCATTCDRKGCLQADGKTACVCNPDGYYACAPFKNGNWE
jgi:hypothetical protein